MFSIRKWYEQCPFAFPAEAGPHFTDPGGMEGWVDLADYTPR